MSSDWLGLYAFGLFSVILFGIIQCVPMPPLVRNTSGNQRMAKSFAGIVIAFAGEVILSPKKFVDEFCYVDKEKLCDNFERIVFHDRDRRRLVLVSVLIILVLKV